MLLLVAKDSWKVPRKISLEDISQCIRLSKSLNSSCNRSSPEYVQGSFSEADILSVDRIEQKLEHLWPLVIPIVIYIKQKYQTFLSNFHFDVDQMTFKLRISLMTHENVCPLFLYNMGNTESWLILSI